jgi:hypothetical protein
MIFSPVDRLRRETDRARFWNLLLRPGIPIVDEGGVHWRCSGVELGEEDDDDDLLFNRETVRGPFSVGLGCVVGFLRGCCWAAEVHGGKPGKFSLHFHFSNFLFSFSVFIYWFEFKLNPILFLQVLNHLNFNSTS